MSCAYAEAANTRGARMLFIFDCCFISFLPSLLPACFRYVSLTSYDSMTGGRYSKCNTIIRVDSDEGCCV